MQPILPIAPTSYTLHVITTASRTHVAQLLQPDGHVVSEWVTICSRWRLKSKVARLCESIEESPSTKATLPIYYATRTVTQTRTSTPALQLS